MVSIIHLPFQLDIPRAGPYPLKESLSPPVQDLKKKKKKKKKKSKIYKNWSHIRQTYDRKIRCWTESNTGIAGS
jgi:hypothetical protein